MTSIRETASETLHFTAVLGWFDADGLGPEITASPNPLTGIPWEPLLQLDAPGWARVFADNDVDRDFTRRLDRLVAAWLTQDDYRQLREIASKKTDLPVGGAAEATFSDWINDSACKRLSHLVMGMRFTEPQVPVCYALCNADRSQLSECLLGEILANDSDLASEWLILALGHRNSCFENRINLPQEAVGG